MKEKGGDGRAWGVLDSPEMEIVAGGRGGASWMLMSSPVAPEFWFWGQNKEGVEGFK